MIVKDFHTGQPVERFSVMPAQLHGRCANCGAHTPHFDHLYGWHICPGCDSDTTARELTRDVYISSQVWFPLWLN